MIARRTATPRPIATRWADVDTFRVLPHLMALAAAYALAFPIGWDREREERSAGLRTFPLVALAACCFVQTTETLLQHSPDGPSVRISRLQLGISVVLRRG